MIRSWQARSSPRYAWSLFKQLIYQIISSEQSYLKSLNIVKSVFHDPLQRLAVNKKDLDNSKLSVVFSNFEFVTSVTTDLCLQLLSMDSGKDSTSELADIFLSSVPNIKFTYVVSFSWDFNNLGRYETYVKDYNQALKMLSWLEVNSVSFRDFLEEQKRSELQNNALLTLPALLITPIQRLPKYELLLQVCFHHHAF